MKWNEKQKGLSAAISCRKGVFLSTALPADWIYWKLLFCNPVVNFLLMFPSYFEMSRPPFQPRQTHFYDSHESIASRFGKKVLSNTMIVFIQKIFCLTIKFRAEGWQSYNGKRGAKSDQKRLYANIQEYSMLHFLTWHFSRCLHNPYFFWSSKCIYTERKAAEGKIPRTYKLQKTSQLWN